MYQINDMVCYASKGIFQIQAITKKKDKDHKLQQWYTLYANHDGLETTIQTPAENVYIRALANADEIEALLSSMEGLENIWIEDKHQREDCFKKLLASGALENWAQLAKSIYLTREERIQLKKDISEKDKQYLIMAEELLYNEIAYALHIPREEVWDIIKSRVKLPS